MLMPALGGSISCYHAGHCLTCAHWWTPTPLSTILTSPLQVPCCVSGPFITCVNHLVPIEPGIAVSYSIAYITWISTPLNFITIRDNIVSDFKIY